MAKQHMRFTTLVLDYLDETRMSPEEFSEFLKDWRQGGVSVNAILGGPETMEMLLAMIFSARHTLKKELSNPEFDRMGFFVQYQLNLPLDDSPLFAELFRDLPTELYSEIAASSLSLEAMFIPQPSPWTQPAMMGPGKVELGYLPERRVKPKPKPLPTPTHKAPSTLQ